MVEQMDRVVPQVGDLQGLYLVRSMVESKIAEIHKQLGISGPITHIPDEGVQVINVSTPKPADYNIAGIANRPVVKKNRKLSVDARQRISNAQKKRWEEEKKRKRAEAKSRRDELGRKIAQ